MSERPLLPHYPFEGPRGLLLDPQYALFQSRPGLGRVRLAYGGWAWLATRYADVRAVLESPAFTRSGAGGAQIPSMTPVALTPGSLVFLDPPEHTRLREAMAGWFRRANIDRIVAHADTVSGILLDGIQRNRRPADLVAAFVRPLSAAVTSEVFGTGLAAQPAFDAWAGARSAALSTLSRQAFANVEQ